MMYAWIKSVFAASTARAWLGHGLSFMAGVFNGADECRQKGLVRGEAKLQPLRLSVKKLEVAADAHVATGNRGKRYIVSLIGSPQLGGTRQLIIQTMHVSCELVQTIKVELVTM